MNQLIGQNLETSSKPFSALDLVTKQFRHRNILGLFLSIFGILSLICAIILFSTIGLMGILAILPVPILLIPGLWIIIPFTRLRVIASYRKVKQLQKKENVEALKASEKLPLKTSQANIQLKNFLIRLFSIAALIDLNDSNCISLATQFYNSCITDGIGKTEAKVILEIIALKYGREFVSLYI